MGLFFSKHRKADKILNKSPSKLSTDDCFFVLAYLSETSEEEVYNSIKTGFDYDNPSEDEINNMAKMLVLQQMDKRLEEEERREDVMDDEYLREKARLRAQRDFGN